MSAGLTRRGFAKVASAGLAALCLPPTLLTSRANATAPGVLVPRWELAARGLELTLFVRSALDAPIEVLSHAVDLQGELHVGDARHPLTFLSVGRETQRRSRAGFRLQRSVVVGTEHDTRYDTFTATWPADVPRGGTLALATTLRPELEHLTDARARLVDLGGLRFELPVARSA